jgi:hypothetical protein
MWCHFYQALFKFFTGQKTHGYKVFWENNVVDFKALVEWIGRQ